MQRDCVCFYCLGDADLCFDRRGKPYTRCVLCGARSFLPTRQALVGFAVSQSTMRAAREQMREDRAYAERATATSGAFIASLRDALAAPPLAAPSPAPTAEPLPLARTA